MIASRSKEGGASGRKTTPQTNAAPLPEEPSKMVSELLRLKQENRQLRRELDDANYRIRAMEKERALALLFALDGPDDCSSVEIHPAPSVTSSTTTIPTGSYPASQSRLRQKQRERGASRSRQEPPREISDDSSVESSRGSTSFRSYPFTHISQFRTKGLRQPFESVSDLSSASSSFEGGSMVNIRVPTSIYTKHSLLRMDSTESDSSIEEKLLGEI